MKTFRVLIAVIFAVMALAAYANAGPSAKIIRIPAANNMLDMRPGSGVLHDYYIGLHSPDGKCVTKVIKAETLGDAFTKGVKQCSDCALYDLTDKYKGKGKNTLAWQNMRYCPVSETKQ